MVNHKAETIACFDIRYTRAHQLLCRLLIDVRACIWLRVRVASRSNFVYMGSCKSSNAPTLDDRGRTPTSCSALCFICVLVRCSPAPSTSCHITTHRRTSPSATHHRAHRRRTYSSSVVLAAAQAPMPCPAAVTRYARAGFPMRKWHRRE